MNDGEFAFVYSTFPDRESAEKVGLALVKAKLAACVNIFPPMTSIYEWDGRIEIATEHAALIKTRRAFAERVIAAVRPLHPYSVPCFLVLPIAFGTEDYLTWVRAQTGDG